MLLLESSPILNYQEIEGERERENRDPTLQLKRSGARRRRVLQWEEGGRVKEEEGDHSVGEGWVED